MSGFKPMALSDQELIEMTLNNFKGAIKKNYYGVEAPADSTPKTLRDWNANGLAEIAKSYEEIKKTLSVANVAAVTPEFVMPELIDINRKRFPFSTSIQKVPLMGKKARRPYDNTNATPVWQGGDGADLTAVDVTPTEVTANLAYTYLPGAISYPAKQVAKETIDIYAKRTEKYYYDFMFYKEKILFRGDPSGTSAVASAIDLSAETSSVEGILPELEDQGQLTDLAGARGINLGDVETSFETVEDNGGYPAAVFTDRSTYTRLRKEASAAMRMDPDTPKFGFGLNEFNIDGIPVLWTHGLSTTSGQRAAVTVDFRAIAEHVSLAPEAVPVAQNLADRAEFFIRNYWTATWIAKWCYAYVDAA